jgi:hypothetical protein
VLDRALEHHPPESMLDNEVTTLGMNQRPVGMFPTQARERQLRASEEFGAETP